MDMSTTFEVRDMRSKSKFFVDDEYLNGYAKLCGPNATMVYLCLCRHSDRHQESFPSIELMATKTGVSRDSIMRGIKSLVDWNIVSKSRVWRKGSQVTNNTYVLLDKSVWKPKEASRCEPLGTGEASRKSANKQVAVSDTKDTHRKDTHTCEDKSSLEYDIVPDGDEDKKTSKPDNRVNDKLAVFRLFGEEKKPWWIHKQQKVDALALFDSYTLDQLKKAISIAQANRDDQFCPKINTPSDLARRMESLLDYKERNRIA